MPVLIDVCPGFEVNGAVFIFLQEVLSNFLVGRAIALFERKIVGVLATRAKPHPIAFG